jgi:HSP20 family protein
MPHVDSMRKRRDSLMSPAGTTWPSWKWIEEIFHDSNWHQMIKIEECREGQWVIVRAELPGVDPVKDVDVEVIDGSLLISAEKSETHEAHDGHFHRSEFRHGSLTRSVPIPMGVDRSSIEATYKDGVLEVRMTVPDGVAETTSRRIQVTRG